MTSKDDTMEAYGVDGHAMSLSLPAKAWVAKGDQACPCCGSPLTGDCAIAADESEAWLRSYIGKKYVCGSVFVFSTVKRGLLVLMYNTPPVCRELKDESEDSI